MVESTYIAVFIIGVVGGFLDSTVGSGGLVIISALTFLGLPIQTVIATDRLGTLGYALGAFPRYFKAKKIIWGYIMPLSILSLIGSYIGANLLISVQSDYLETIIGIVMLAVIPLIFYEQSVGVKHAEPIYIKKAFGYIFYFLIMIYNGFFGTGAGPIATYNMLFMFGFTIIEASATAIIPWFLLSVSSLYIFLQKGIVNVQYGLILFAGMVLGGYLGAHVAVKQGNVWLKRVFAIFVIISALKLLLS